MRRRALILTTCLLAPACGDSLSFRPGDFTTISAGFWHTCAVLIDGAGFCWGLNGGGAVGSGEITLRDTLPRAVEGQLVFTQIDAGFAHTCGITSLGTAYCWGLSSEGGLGTGDTTTRTDHPVPVAGGLIFKAITAGLGFACGLTLAGDAYCWGENGLGQLGRDTTSTRAPVAVSGGHTFVAISAGEHHTCAIATDGAGYCWGSNDQGNLGTGDTAFATRHATPGLIAGGLTFTSIATGERHTCGIARTAKAYCWGYGFYGQLGTGNRTSQSTPARVTGGHSFATVSAGRVHSCAIDVDKRLFCWGANASGQLGAFAADECELVPGPGQHTPCTFTPIAVSGYQFRALSVGGYYTCALGFLGSAFCWGANEYGQIGNGTADNEVPDITRVPDP